MGVRLPDIVSEVAVTAVRGISDSLHNRLLQVWKSPGQRQVESRRDWAVFQAKRGRQERGKFVERF